MRLRLERYGNWKGAVRTTCTLRDGGRDPSSRPREGTLPRADALQCSLRRTFPGGQKLQRNPIIARRLSARVFVINSILVLITCSYRRRWLVSIMVGRDAMSGEQVSQLRPSVAE
jgi:hypothetical protein